MVNRMIRYMDDYPVMSAMVTLPIAFWFGTTVLSGADSQGEIPKCFCWRHL